MAAVQAAHLAIGLASTVILARLLAPGDFGLIAMVGAVTHFLGLFRDLGLSSATVQRADLTRPQLSALFWINVALGLLMAGVMTVPLVRLEGVLRLMAGAALFAGVYLPLLFGLPGGRGHLRDLAMLHRDVFPSPSPLSFRTTGNAGG